VGGDWVGRGGCVWVGGRCTFAMVQPREKTFHELLRQTQKIPRPEVSPVFTENVRMQGPGVKEVSFLSHLLTVH
jgi:hypothetical protein